MRAFVRILYGFVLELHPHKFRAEFGEEMLWLFDEHTHFREARMGRVILYAQLLLDVLRSAFIQHVLREQSNPEVVSPYFSQIGSSTRIARAAEGGFIIFSSALTLLTIAFCLHWAILCM